MSDNQENNQENKNEETPKKKIVKMEALSQTHGKTEKFKPTTLDQVWGDTGSWKYNTMDEGEYRGKIEGMPKSDLFAHANKVGLIPIDDRTQLIKRLMAEFKRHVSAYRYPHVDKTPSKPLDSEAEKILKEGR